jgi:hypothetical protein
MIIYCKLVKFNYIKLCLIVDFIIHLCKFKANFNINWLNL